MDAKIKMKLKWVLVALLTIILITIIGIQTGKINVNTVKADVLKQIDKINSDTGRYQALIKNDNIFIIDTKTSRLYLRTLSKSGFVSIDLGTVEQPVIKSTGNQSFTSQRKSGFIPDKP